ncbi:MAG: beta-ketoacyl-[acyl-carrier-protein] synthase family protein [Saprospiraceae bacterium]
MNKRVHIAGMGVISAIGHSRAESLNSLRTSTDGISKLQGFQSILADTRPVGEVRISNTDLSNKLNVDANWTRTALLGLHAVNEAIEGIDLNAIDQRRIGLISANTVGGMDKTEGFYRDFLQNGQTGDIKQLLNHPCGTATELIANHLGIQGFVSTINTACSSSVNAIMLAARLIDAGKLDLVIAGGADALCCFTLNGFNSLMILDKEPSRPFDANRNGLNLGEGAGYLVLVSDQFLVRHGIKSLATVRGFANTNDAYHQTASSPEGRGSYDAMSQALTMAGLPPNEIDYINLHGTGTINNDSSEGTAIQRLFGAKAPRLSSTKAFTGHTLGASGGIEAVFSILALQEGCVFPNLRFENPIPELQLIPQLTFESGLPIRNVMSNSFGFGGNCSSIIFSNN